DELRGLARGRRDVVFFARGSSDTAAVYGRYLCELEAHVPAALGAPSIATLYRSALDLSGSVAVVLSQSGETTELVDTARWARGCGARTVGITNVEDSALASEVDVSLATRAGPELAVPATKSHTAQLAALAVFAAALAPEPQPLLDGLMPVPGEAARLL